MIFFVVVVVLYILAFCHFVVYSFLFVQRRNLIDLFVFELIGVCEYSGE